MTTVPRQSPKKNDTRTYSWWAWSKAYLALVLEFPLYATLWFLATFVRRLSPYWTQVLLDFHTYYTDTHKMDFRIPPDTSIPSYMDRWWWLPRNAFLNVYLHIVRRSDDDRALHDHPWWNFSCVLDGGYFEHTILAGGIHKKVWTPAGTMRFRWHGKLAHRLELERNWSDVEGTPDEIPVRTIFITGPVMRRWGFHDSSGWVDAYDWDAFCAAKGVKTMPMGGGSDGAISDRNKHKAN